MADYVNLIKLSVGSESVESLIDWQRNRSRQIKGNRYFHITRMWPKREAEILKGGSIYWVIQGVVQCRQKIVGFDEVVGEDGIRRCAILLDNEIVRTEPVRKRPFQGWRYLDAGDAPRDLTKAEAAASEDIPPKLMAALSEIGVR
ncbi:DUF1489 family protein [Alphaproteobacteria bacterium GH1-50]|uniref:DUF1489 family protein n=1 Tax=Kangsaoukella pontilimi TaxID=2691042 RepID=A0A7C9ISC2_9RHOB|nr:DUF1489 domain-containing protein [Kangsaoukella pontilimi]MXQ09623.1 DUF1489 family protein [Kangsaoukella pontilimi]